MKFSLSNFFSVMAASSFVSSANALALADYEGKQIKPGTSVALDMTDDAAVTAALAGACEIGDVTATGAVLTCNFAYPLLEGSTIVAKLYSGPCSASVGNEAVAIDETDSSKVVGTAGTTVADAMAMDAFDASGKNSETIVQEYCARADVWDDANLASGSVLAYMMTATTTVTFDNEGTFTVAVTTAAFDAAAAVASADRQVEVFARFGECAGDVTALKALSQGTGQIAIGSVLDICVFVDSDFDTDVQIDLIKSVDIKDDTTVITSPIDVNGNANFVTTIGSYGSAVDIKTLMIPKIYDAIDGTSFSIGGTVNYLYVRRLSSGERRLQTESAPFSLEVELTKNDLPQVAMNEEESGAMSAGVGMMALAAGVAALL